MPLPNGYMTSDEMIAAIDAQLDAIIADHTDKLERAIEACRLRIINMLMTEDFEDIDMKRLQTLHQNAVKTINEVYGTAVQSLDYSEIANLVSDSLKASNVDVAFTVADKQMMDALKGNLADVYVKLGASVGTQIGQAIYSSILGGVGADELAAQVTNALIGLSDRAGRPMTQYVGMYTQDGVMEFYSAIHRKKAKDVGIKKFLYAGTVIKTTRPFCRARVGNVYTEEQIQSWQNMQWKGKKEGNIWLTRGGYRCRHHFRPVVDPVELEEIPF